MAKQKFRLDVLLVEKGLCKSRTEAQALILSGQVYVNGMVVNKPGTQVSSEENNLRIQERMPFVSRGGLKLQKALSAFSMDVTGLYCLDVGASTGGFTDCLLKAGAGYVTAIDVGYGQLDWSLRNDNRVQVLEKTNIKLLQSQQLQQHGRYSIGVCDTSFISLTKVLPPLALLLEPDAEMVALLKPQFEFKDYYMADKAFNGVVKCQKQRFTIIQGVCQALKNILPGWQLAGLDCSPITGPKGNKEYLLYFTRGNRSVVPESPACASAFPSDEQILAVIEGSP
jgi:23S rRNA (cytidine1920-2'-O)/16S rRNA (cytidine1409-2'-O)-methyltransferase